MPSSILAMQDSRSILGSFVALSENRGNRANDPCDGAHQSAPISEDWVEIPFSDDQFAAHGTSECESLPDTEPFDFNPQCPDLDASTPSNSRPSIRRVKGDARRDISEWVKNCPPSLADEAWTTTQNPDPNSPSPAWHGLSFPTDTVKSAATVDEICLRYDRPYLHGHALEHFCCLKINGRIIISEVSFADIETPIDALISVGFWSVRMISDRAGVCKISAVKPARPVPTSLELEHHGLTKAWMTAEERFLSHALQDIQSDAARLPEVRGMLCPGLRIRFEVKLFQMRRQYAGVHVEAMFRRYLRRLAAGAGGLEAPPEFTWLLEGVYPPLEYLEVLEQVAFVGLLLECASGKENDPLGCDLTDEHFSPEDVEKHRNFCKGINGEYDLRSVAIDPSHARRTLCVWNEDFCNGIWATVLLTEGAEVAAESLLDGYRVVRLCEPIFGWLSEFMGDAKREECWIEFDKGLGALVF